MDRFNRRKAPGRPFHPAVPYAPPDIDIPGESPGYNKIEAAKIDLRARQKAFAEILLAHGYDEIFDITGQIINQPAAGLTVDLMTFTVPTGQVLMINQIGVMYSNPQIASCNIIGWRVMVNNGRLPYVWGDTANAYYGGDYFYDSCADIGNPRQIEPIWIQAAETISIQLFNNGTLGCHVSLHGRMSGRIYKPTSLNLLGV